MPCVGRLEYACAVLDGGYGRAPKVEVLGAFDWQPLPTIPLCIAPCRQPACTANSLPVLETKMTLGQADETTADGVYTTPCWECAAYCGALATDKKRHGSQTALPIRPAHIRPVHSESNSRAPGLSCCPNSIRIAALARAARAGSCASRGTRLSTKSPIASEESRTHEPEAIAGATSGAAFDP